MKYGMGRKREVYRLRLCVGGRKKEREKKGFTEQERVKKGKGQRNIYRRNINIVE